MKPIILIIFCLKSGLYNPKNKIKRVIQDLIRSYYKIKYKIRGGEIKIQLYI
jgi:hypothetical protein